MPVFGLRHQLWNRDKALLEQKKAAECRVRCSGKARLICFRQSDPPSGRGVFLMHFGMTESGKISARKGQRRQEDQTTEGSACYEGTRVSTSPIAFANTKSS